MKKLLLLTFAFFLLTFSFSQEYGWVDISDNIPGETQSLYDIHFISPDTGWITSFSSPQIFYTTDNGQSFVSQDNEYGTDILAIYMFNANEGYAGSRDGILYKTSNHGLDWNYDASLGASTITDIDFPANSTMASIGYSCAINGKIFKITPTSKEAMTFDAGPTTVDFMSITFPYADQGWACGESTIVHYDGGTTWLHDQSYGGGIAYNCIYFVPGTTQGWCVGDAGTILHTTNGTTWQGQNNPDAVQNILFDVFFRDASNGWAVGTGGTILYTTNGGANWAIQSSGTTNTLNKVFACSSDVYVTGNGGTLLKYTLLFETDSTNTTLTTINIDGTSLDNFNSNTYNYIVELSGGTTEIPELTATTTVSGAIINITQAISLPGTATIVVTSKDGQTQQTYTIHFSVIAGIGDFEQKNTLNIYPNPTAGKFKVQSLKFKGEDVIIEIYDLNSRKLLEQQIPPGSENAEIDVSHLKNGVYFCRLFSGNYNATQKLIIQK